MRSKYLQFITIWSIFALLLALIPGSALACYQVLEEDSSVVIIKCDNGLIHSILNRGKGWYWNGIRFDNRKSAIHSACQCE